ncbi:YybH family protein [Engelhardtia mirabilis]|uniref:SnoaL-like domain protein n=1 Tax=Engelhardtia mirabilis TaxID=2528011 RepID=A0A518BPZ8_9BACT|nr:SnoaL-like domain protein [Planctomycetes bacterium Pla133]QDV03373.1 SnoaL-like domain protein [Planctomycetes bacterium Pla86]
MDAEHTLLQRLRAANEAWTQGRPEEVAEFFHPSVVMAAPDGRVLVRGRVEMVQSFVDYAEGARTVRFEEFEHRVQVSGDTAVVSYLFEVEYVVLEEPGVNHVERGRELLVFARGGERDDWTVIWREQTPLDAPELD